MKALCVFCGSSSGADPAYRAAAVALGEVLANQGVRLVYGGGRVGLMGLLADTVLARGGEVYGVIPEALVRLEVQHEGLTRQHIVANMHERKALMAELADGFVALPGGIGTFEELFEVWTWGQLGMHAKPYGLLNVSGFYDGLLAFLDHAQQQGFLRAPHRDMLLNDTDPAQLLQRLRDYQPPVVQGWIERSDT
jgi:uncharacterized protein (TIGR00730 family)